MNKVLTQNCNVSVALKPWVTTSVTLECQLIKSLLVIKQAKLLRSADNAFDDRIKSNDEICIQRSVLLTEFRGTINQTYR